jgi:hypothetical protein
MTKLFLFCAGVILPSLLTAQIDYNSQIQSIFNSLCISCHGSSGGLSLTSYDNLMAGGNHGDLVVPFDADNSILAQKIQSNPPFGSRMPKNNQSYFDNNPDELQLIIDWINEGASEFVAVIVGAELPGEFAITACYPNPFNPSTTIRFSVETHDYASLQIYDTTGRLVETLVNDRFEGGEYEVEWNASLHPSGLYFARLLADGMSFTAKLLLLK